MPILLVTRDHTDVVGRNAEFPKIPRRVLRFRERRKYPSYCFYKRFHDLVLFRSKRSSKRPPAMVFHSDMEYAYAIDDILSTMIHPIQRLVFSVVLIALFTLPRGGAQTRKPTPPKSLRLYVLDCGKITVANGDSMGFKPGELATANMITPCFLIVHPKGTMMWDTGEIPDSAFASGVSPATQGAFTVDRPLLPQLAAIGYTPADITFLALSHYHGDHVANANAFAGSTWIVQQGDRDAIFAPRPANAPRMGAVPNPAFFTDLANSKTIVLNGEDHDVFGDGTVVIKFTPGHTPGHQSLFLKLAKTGPVLLSGDLYHYPEEITYKRIPSFDTDKEQTAKSRAMIEEFVKKNNAQLWIQHDYTAGIKRRIAPEFYE
jgi:N-acyl homoserine lactone hydrolase